MLMTFTKEQNIKLVHNLSKKYKKIKKKATTGKGENVANQHFSFPTMFSKATSTRSIKH